MSAGRAELYRRLPLTVADRWWCELAATSVDGRVLELGAGTGRLTVALAAAGAQVTAVEHDPAMLAALRARLAAVDDPAIRDRVEVAAADATDLPDLGVHGVVMAPSALLNELPDGAARRDLLVAAAGALHRDGVLALHLLGPWWLAQAHGEVHGRLDPLDGGESPQVEIRFGTLSVDGRRAAQLRYTFADGTVVDDHLDAAVVTPGELGSLLAVAALRPAGRFGADPGEPLGPLDTAWHVVARPRARPVER